jgi:predicted flap endonuclease-1-like 5' DNA nuclease
MTAETGVVDVLILAGSSLVWFGYELRDRVVDDDQDDRDEVDAAREAYVAGEIDERELERRLALALDPRADEIRDVVEHVDGVGPATSAAIAQEFDDVDDVREASREDLEDVHGVGPSRVDALQVAGVVDETEASRQ